MLINILLRIQIFYRLRYSIVQLKYLTKFNCILLVLFIPNFFNRQAQFSFACFINHCRPMFLYASRTAFQMHLFISMEPTGVEVECRLEGAVCLVEERGIVHPTMNCDRNKNFPSVKRYHGVTELLVQMENLVNVVIFMLCLFVVFCVSHNA